MVEKISAVPFGLRTWRHPFASRKMSWGWRSPTVANAHISHRLNFQQRYVSPPESPSNAKPTALTFKLASRLQSQLRFFLLTFVPAACFPASSAQRPFSLRAETIPSGIYTFSPLLLLTSISGFKTTLVDVLLASLRSFQNGRSSSTRNNVTPAASSLTNR